MLLVTAGIVWGVYLLKAIPPVEDSWYPRCQLHSLTGLHCPGCGTTRALNACLNGRIAQAVAFNSLAFIVAPFVCWSLFQSVRTWHQNRELKPESAPSRFLKLFLVILVVAFGILRNIPWSPFTLLAPHEL